MPAIRCHYNDCVQIQNGYCAAPSIELDPDGGCLTYEPMLAVNDAEEWEEGELGDLWHDDDELLYEDADDAEWYADGEPD